MVSNVGFRIQRVCLWMQVLCVLFASEFVHAGAYRLVYKVHETGARSQHTTQGKEPASPSSQDFTREVILEPQRVLVRDGDKESLYDFEHRTLASRTPGSTCSEISSLFTEVGKRQAELKNRVFISSIHARLKGSIQPDDPLALESLFGIEIDPPTGKKLTIQKDKEWRVAYSSSGAKSDWLARYIPGSEPLPEAVRRSYGRFLGHHYPLHPMLRNELESTPAPPGRLEFRMDEVGYPTEVSLELMEAGPFEGAIPEAVPCPPKNTLEELAAKAIKQKFSGEIPPDFYSRQISALLAQGKAFDALLTGFEEALATGKQNSEWFQAAFLAAKNDPQAIIFNSEKEISGGDPKKSLELLETISLDGVSKGYVLGIFKADKKVALKDIKGALDFFLAALRANPQLAGVYKDLGDLYYSSSKLDHAWACWNTARTLAPSHPMLESVNRFEEKLSRQYPQFF